MCFLSYKKYLDPLINQVQPVTSPVYKKTHRTWPPAGMICTQSNERKLKIIDCTVLIFLINFWYEERGAHLKTLRLLLYFYNSWIYVRIMIPFPKWPRCSIKPAGNVQGHYFFVNNRYIMIYTCHVRAYVNIINQCTIDQGTTI